MRRFGGATRGGMSNAGDCEIRFLNLNPCCRGILVLGRMGAQHQDPRQFAAQEGFFTAGTHSSFGKRTNSSLGPNWLLVKTRPGVLNLPLTR